MSQTRQRPGWLNLLAIGSVIFPMMSAVGQTIEIHLVDGRNGKPLFGTSSYVNVWVGTERKAAIAIATDDRGVAHLKLTQDTTEENVPLATGHGSNVENRPVVMYSDLLRINAPYVLCGAGTNAYSWLQSLIFTTKEVVDHGYVSQNTCGKAARSPQPGHIVLFVRPLTFWEKMRT